MPTPHAERAAKMTPEQRSLRSRIASRTRTHPNDPGIEDDRRDLRALTLEEHVRRVVDQAPPLTQEQRDRIAAALQPSTPRAAIA